MHTRIRPATPQALKSSGNAPGQIASPRNVHRFSTPQNDGKDHHGQLGSLKQSVFQLCPPLCHDTETIPGTTLTHLQPTSVGVPPRLFAERVIDEKMMMINYASRMAPGSEAKRLFPRKTGKQEGTTFFPNPEACHDQDRIDDGRKCTTGIKPPKPVCQRLVHDDSQ